MRSHRLHDLLAVGGIQVGSGLICQDEGRFGCQGAGDCHALLLPAAELVWALVPALAQPNCRQQIAHALAALRGAVPVQEQRHLDVLIRRQGGDQGEELEDKADRTTAHVRPLVAVEPG